MKKDKNKKAAVRRLFPLLLLLCVIAAEVAVFRYVKTARAKPEYIFLMSGVRNSEDFLMFTAFEETITGLGGEPTVLDLEEEDYSSISQRKMLKAAVSDNTVCIVVNAATNSNLEELLTEYADRGIKILSCLSETDVASRDLHVGTVDPARAGEVLFEKLADICGGSGKFALISESSRLVFATDLIMYIRLVFEERRYPDMVLSDVLYGYEDEETVLETIRQYLTEHADVKVLLCLSDRMTELSCQAVTELGLAGQVAIVGMGKTEYLTDYVSEEALELHLFSCDMEAFGRMAAGIAYQLVNGGITGAVGETVAVEGNSYSVEEDLDVQDGLPTGTVVYLYEEYEWEEYQ